MAIRRLLGGNGPSLSQVAYGSMRLSEAPDRLRPIEVLLRLHDAGIDTHHSSFEYDSYPLYLDTLKQLSQTSRSVAHIVKLAEPSFDDITFDAGRLVTAVDDRLAELGTDHIAVVQWMVRTPDPSNETVTLELLHEQRSEIASAFDQLKSAGKVGEFAVFPYTNRFGIAAQQEISPISLCGYLSLFERDSHELLATGAPFIALRPFAGASPSVESAPEAVNAEADPARRYEAALRYPLLHPSVATTVVSVNQDHHIDLAIKVAETGHADLTEFEKVSQRVSERLVDAV